ncbi:hypothetical protein LTR32_007542, partial [Rachicladosporium monterosium]
PGLDQLRHHRKPAGRPFESDVHLVHEVRDESPSSRVAVPVDESWTEPQTP